jgi:hypothetical protein
VYTHARNVQGTLDMKLPFGPRVVIVRRFSSVGDSSSSYLERDNSVADNSVLSFCTGVHRRQVKLFNVFFKIIWKFAEFLVQYKYLHISFQGIKHLYVH